MSRDCSRMRASSSRCNDSVRRSSSRISARRRSISCRGPSRFRRSRSRRAAWRSRSRPSSMPLNRPLDPRRSSRDSAPSAPAPERMSSDISSSMSAADRSGPSGSCVPSQREYRARIAHEPTVFRENGCRRQNVRDMREERKVVTAVFADLVGSTALGEALDPEEVKLIVGEAVARIVHAVEAFGGTVKDLAGDGVLALFGAPVSHEDDAERGVRAAVRITQDVAAYAGEVAAGWGVEGFGVRVGVNTGSVVLGPIGAGERVEYAAFGDTVNTAARLQSAAEPGQILVGLTTQRMVESQFGWAEPSRLTVKGKKDAVVAVAVTGVRPTARARAASEAQSRLVGRSRELAQIQEALDDVLAGRGGILFITGEAGIGKSRLVLETRDRFSGVGPEFG